MGITDHIKGMNDPWLKPRMLRSLVRDRLPDEKRASAEPAELADVLSRVKTHGLLSESNPYPPDRKLAEAWKSSVDDWVDRLLALISSDMPDKCWAGICLLGVTCGECSTDRFTASYSLWFQKLLSTIQVPSSTYFVKVASCASFADLFTRLVQYPNLKKDATSHAGKLIQSVLQLLSDEDGAEAVWEGAIDLICTLITFFPSSMLRHLDKVEAVLVSKLTSRKVSANMSNKFACCLALLPRARGDEDSWCLMMQKILVAINMLLTDAFQGLEEEDRCSEIMRMLVPSGKEPTPLGGQSMIGESSDQVTKRLRESLVPRVSALMQCCCMMLMNPYPIQVTVPVRPLLASVWRVLLLDGSLHASLSPFTTAMQQELVCSELPALHLNGLELLTAIINGVQSQLLPHAATVVRHLTEYFRRATLPFLRIKVYNIMRMLLVSMGVGMALYLAQEVINNAFTDLNDGADSGSMSSSSHSSKLVNGALVGSGQRKRKHGPMELSNGADIEVEADGRKQTTTLPVKIAALKAVEALLTVGGSLRSECWRSKLDLLLINVATSACNAGWANEGKLSILREESEASRAEFQLAALHALLASLLSPAHVRPPYLSQSLQLFRRGKQEFGTEQAAFCAHALLALEVLIHPRALPLVDFPLAKSSAYEEEFGGMKQSTSSLPKGSLGFFDDTDDDELYKSWLENDEEAKMDTDNQNKRMPNTDLPVHGSVEVSPGEVAAPVYTDGNQVSRSTDVEMQCVDGDDNKAEQGGDPDCNNSASISAGVDQISQVATIPTDVPSGVLMAPGDKDDVLTSTVSDTSGHPNASKTLGVELSTNETAVISQGDAVPNNSSDLKDVVDDASKSLAVDTKSKFLSHGSDSESMDSLPDIVHSDPDSD